MSTVAPVELVLPFRSSWRAKNSPARRVPSHGTYLFATTYAIDFVAVRDRRTATVTDWRTWFSVEPADRFFAFGQPILAPAAGRVVAVHWGYRGAEEDPRRCVHALGCSTLKEWLRSELDPVLWRQAVAISRN